MIHAPLHTPAVPPPVPPLRAAHGGGDVALREAALRLEATFLSEMLKSAGLDAMSGGFGGGIGEDQFASYLRDAQAEEMARAGGIGLAESLFNALKRQDDA